MYLSAVNQLLDTVQRFAPKLGDRTKDHLLVASSFGLACLVIVHGAGWLPFRFLFYAILGFAFLAVMIVCSLREREKTEVPKVNKGLFYLWMLYGVLQLVSGIVNGYEYLPDAVLVLIAFPILQVAWSRLGWEKAFRLTLRGLRYSLYIVLAASILFYPLDGAQYQSMFTNQNLLSTYLMVCFCGLVVEIFEEQKTKAAVGLMIAAGITFAIIYYSGSRTGMLSSTVSLFAVTLIMAARKGGEPGRNLAKGGGILLSMVFFSAVLVYVFKLRTYLPLPYLSACKPAEDYDLVAEKIAVIGKEKMTFLGRTLDQITSGRTAIWKVFSTKLNLWGHRTGQSYYVVRTAPNGKLIEKYYSTAHNFFLQNAYNHGVPCGLVSLALVIWAEIGSVRYAWKNRNGKYSCLPLGFVTTFFISALLSSPNVIFWYIDGLYFCFALGQLLLVSQSQRAEPFSVG